MLQTKEGLAMESYIQVDNRQHRRIPVLWRAVFYSERLFTPGTVLDISPKGWRIASLLAVPAGIRLKLRVWPGPSHYHCLNIDEATVIWMKEHQFGIAIKRVRPNDELMLFELEQWTMGIRSTIRRVIHPS